MVNEKIAQRLLSQSNGTAPHEMNTLKLLFCSFQGTLAIKTIVCIALRESVGTCVSSQWPSNTFDVDNSDAMLMCVCTEADVYVGTVKTDC